MRSGGVGPLLGALFAVLLASQERIDGLVCLGKRRCGGHHQNRADGKGSG